MSPGRVSKAMTVLDADATVVATSDSVSADVGGERVLLNVDAGTYHGMNAVGSLVFDLVDEPRSVRTVVDTVREEFDVDAATADGDVRAFLSELVEAGLVDVVDPA